MAAGLLEDIGGPGLADSDDLGKLRELDIHKCFNTRHPSGLEPGDAGFPQSGHNGQVVVRLLVG